MTTLCSNPLKRPLTRPPGCYNSGPVTILNWSFPRKDISRKAQAFQLALALRAEMVDLEAAGCKVIQVPVSHMRLADSSGSLVCLDSQLQGQPGAASCCAALDPPLCVSRVWRDILRLAQHRCSMAGAGGSLVMSTPSNDQQQRGRHPKVAFRLLLSSTAKPAL